MRQKSLPSQFLNPLKAPDISTPSLVTAFKEPDKVNQENEVIQENTPLISIGKSSLLGLKQALNGIKKRSKKLPARIPLPRPTDITPEKRSLKADYWDEAMINLLLKIRLYDYHDKIVDWKAIATEISKLGRVVQNHHATQKYVELKHVDGVIDLFIRQEEFRRTWKQIGFYYPSQADLGELDSMEDTMESFAA